MADNRGLRHTICLIAEEIYLLPSYIWSQLHPRTFYFDGHEYAYCRAHYNRAWLNERAIEVPIIQRIVKQHQGKRILEVGNVLSHYSRISHDIVDKYEKVHGVINEDIVNFKTTKQYDLIVSISTLEHVGWDEEPRQPKKVLTALTNMRGLVAPGGMIVFSLPAGYNPKLDRMVKAGQLGLTRCHYLKHIAKWKWIETTHHHAWWANYDTPFPGANALIIATIKVN